MKKIKIIGIVIVIIFILTIALYFIYFLKRFSFSEELSYFAAPNDTDTTLTIAIIGDSWVAGKKLDTLLLNKLHTIGVKPIIISSGCPGANSKAIYHNLFREDSLECSSKYIIESNPDYCIVIAGVNDAAGQVGVKFYSHHTILIVKSLLHYGIKPVVVELPEFGIEEYTNGLDFVRSGRNKVYAKLTNQGQLDNITTYREYLAQRITAENLQERIILVDFDDICSDYNDCLEYFANPTHLNDSGNEKLIQKIVSVISKELTQEETPLLIR